MTLYLVKEKKGGLYFLSVAILRFSFFVGHAHF